MRIQGRKTLKKLKFSVCGVPKLRLNQGKYDQNNVFYCFQSFSQFDQVTAKIEKSPLVLKCVIKGTK